MRIFYSVIIIKIGNIGIELFNFLIVIINIILRKSQPLSLLLKKYNELLLRNIIMYDEIITLSKSQEFM